MKDEEQIIYQKIGKNIQFYRIARGFSQQRLAEQLSMTFQQLQKYEKGINRISIIKLERIAEILEVSYNDLRGSNNSREDFFSLSELEIGFLSSLSKLHQQQINTVKDLIDFMINHRSK